MQVCVCLKSAVRMHSRDQRLLWECALNPRGLAAEIVLCFPKYMLSLEQRIAVDQSVSLAKGFCCTLEGDVYFKTPKEQIHSEDVFIYVAGLNFYFI